MIVEWFLSRHLELLSRAVRNFSDSANPKILLQRDDLSNQKQKEDSQKFPLAEPFTQYIMLEANQLL